MIKLKLLYIRRNIKIPKSVIIKTSYNFGVFSRFIAFFVYFGKKDRFCGKMDRFWIFFSKFFHFSTFLIELINGPKKPLFNDYRYLSPNSYIYRNRFHRSFQTHLWIHFDFLFSTVSVKWIRFMDPH